MNRIFEVIGALLGLQRRPKTREQMLIDAIPIPFTATGYPACQYELETIRLQNRVNDLEYKLHKEKIAKSWAEYHRDLAIRRSEPLEINPNEWTTAV